MPPEKLPDIDYLLEHYTYNQDTGKLSTKTITNGGSRVNVYSWKECKSHQSRGYFRVSVKNKRYLVHRICWKMFYKEDPYGQIDHINMDKTDNRICNLRVVKNSINHTNMGQEWPYIFKHRAGLACHLPSCFCESLTKRKIRKCITPHIGYLGLLKILPAAITQEQKEVLCLIKEKFIESIPR